MISIEIYRLFENRGLYRWTEVAAELAVNKELTNIETRQVGEWGKKKNTHEYFEQSLCQRTLTEKKQ